MKRERALGVLVGLGALSIGLSAWQGQAPAASRTITVDQVKENLYVLKGGGGNTAVFVTAAGVVVVDAKNPGWGQPILDEIKKLTAKPVTTLINTHTHGDHVSGNVEFPATVDVIVQDNTKAQMEKMPIFAEQKGRGLPKRSFKDTLRIGAGADEVALYYFGPGHTNGDAWVVFPALRVVHAGDIFARKGLPLVDAANGGSVLHYAATLRKAYAGIRNVDTIVTGHSDTPLPWDDLKVFADFNDDFLAWARAALQSGKPPEEAASEWKMPEKYAGYSAQAPTMFGGIAGRLRLLGEELKK